MSAMNGTLSIPYITSIERTANVNLTEMPTLIYGASNNFCMDLGATEKITLKCERVNPFPYNDSSKNPDNWSNGKWYRFLESIFDRWQNFGKNAKGEWTGGVTLKFVPADSELHPAIAANVFLTGSLGMSYGVQKMSFSLPFQLGNMLMQDVKLDKVTLTLKTATDSGTTKTLTQEVYKGVPTIVSLPSEWTNAKEGMVFHGWQYNSTATEIYDGRAYTYTENATLTAIWLGALKVVACTSDGSDTVPPGASEMMVYAVGGGGGGGGQFTLCLQKGHGLTDPHVYLGGAGGSGETKIHTEQVSPGQKVSWTLGEGGSGGTKGEGTALSTVKQPTAGGGGGDTTVRLDGAVIVTAKGGSGGSPATGASWFDKCGYGTGGQSYCAGGTHGVPGGDSSKALGCGYTAAPNIGSNIGMPGRDITISDIIWPGGPSGGAAAFRYKFRTEDGTWYPEERAYYMSEGGDGVQYTGEDSVGRYANSGRNGGGGGSGEVENSLRTATGSKGIAILVFFR